MKFIDETHMSILIDRLLKARKIRKLKQHHNLPQPNDPIVSQNPQKSATSRLVRINWIKRYIAYNSNSNDHPKCFK